MEHVKTSITLTLQGEETDALARAMQLFGSELPIKQAQIRIDAETEEEADWLHERLDTIIGTCDDSIDVTATVKQTLKRDRMTEVESNPTPMDALWQPSEPDDDSEHADPRITRMVPNERVSGAD
jgi:hypothetical protein